METTSVHSISLNKLCSILKKASSRRKTITLVNQSQIVADYFAYQIVYIIEVSKLDLNIFILI